jgi:hypothetical protein
VPDSLPPRPPSGKGKPRVRPSLEAGWREWVALPELGIPKVKAKLDTGARSSAIHVVSWELVEGEEPPRVRFVVAPVQRDDTTLVEAEAPLADRRKVRSSSGTAQLRPVIVTTLVMGGQRWPIELTLARRPRLRFRMLLGRQALRQKVCVDPAGSFRLGRP